MKKNFAEYDPDDGKLLIIGTLDDYNFTSRMMLENHIELPMRSWDYFVRVDLQPNVVQAKTAYLYSINKTTINADGVDMVAITGLHNPTTVTWPDGEVTVETDGEISFAIDLVGDYSVILEAVPYLKETINVTATD